MRRSWSRLTAILGVALCVGLVSLDTADAQRRGGGFGSRGVRTYRPPPPTRTAPQPAAPPQRSMTQPQPGQTPGAQPGAATRPAAAANAAAQPPRRGGFLGGLGGGLLGGLLAGGLIGAMMGNGFGAGMAGFGAMLLQVAIVGGVIMLVMAFLRRRRESPAQAAGAQPWQGNPFDRAAPPPPSTYGNVTAFSPVTSTQTYVPATAPQPSSDAGQGEEIGVTGGDRDTFERLLMEIQDGFGREDYAALRERTTPEVMGYLAETLAANATSGKRNEITGTRLLEADVAEAWREGDRDYATAAVRFEAINVMRDRTSGAVLEGDPAQPLLTTELWTFVRQGGGAWKLSAIQEVAA